MKLLLVSPPYCSPGEDIGSRSVDYSGNNPPLGILALATYLRQYGFEVEIKDMFKYTSWDEIRKTLNAAKFDMFGISIWTGNHFKAKKILEIVKEKDQNIITLAGGPHASVLDEQVARNYYVDYVIRGEGEETMLELLKAMEGNQDVSRISGLTYVKDGQLTKTLEREPLSNLNGLPFTDFSDIELDDYTEGLWSDTIIPDKLQKEYNIQYVKFAPVITSRGCPAKCTFCFKKFGKPRMRSADNVVDEIKRIYKQHHIKHIRFCDDTLNINEKRLQEICKLIIKENINITWDTSIRAYPLSVETAQLMKESGCIKLSVGVETGSARMMKSIKKGLTTDKVINAFDVCHEVGIPIIANIIVGLPGETKDTIKETYQFLKTIKPDYTLVSILLLYPKTEVYHHAKEVGFINDLYFLETEVVPVYCYEHSYEKLLDYSRKVFIHNFIQQKNYKKILYYSLLRLRERIGHLTHIYINARGFDLVLKGKRYIFEVKSGFSKIYTKGFNGIQDGNKNKD
jgi:Fe-S oxidoreductase